MRGEPQNSNGPSRPSLVGRWIAKFACAFRGLRVALWREDSFCVHLPAALVVCVVAAWLGVSTAEWLALVCCITLVLTSELLNTAIEQLSRAVTRVEHPHIRDSLDVASAAVLVASLGASVVGVLILVRHVVD